MRFRLLSYNIHRAIGVDGRFRPERIEAVLQHHDADVVLLQEVDRNAPRSGHLDLASHFARALEYKFRAAGMNVFLKRGRYGNATLSRFPISRQRNIDLTIAWRKPRGAQHTQILLPWRGGSVPIEIFNVHLGLAERVRRLQLERLLACRDFHDVPSGRACVVAGDTNDWRGILHGQGLADAGFICATNHAHSRKRSIKTFPSFGPIGGLDKIYYRGPMRLLHVHRSRLALTRVASDHLPIIAEFEVHAEHARGPHSRADAPTALVPAADSA